MTSRERVIATLTQNYPDRIPRDVWALPYIQLFEPERLERLKKEFPMDIEIPEQSPGYFDKQNSIFAKTGTYIDDWGSVWHIGEPGIIGEVKKPFVENWSALKSFQSPWHVIEKRDFSHINRICEERDQFMLSEVTARPFERMQFLRGTENTYLDILLETDEFYELLNKVHEFYIEDIKNWCTSKVDGIFFMDDWGSNNALLISPEQWKKVFKPLYKDYCNIIHEAGKYAFFHSDGNITAIYDDLIEVGIDALNSQLFCMDIEELGKKYKGKITFWGEIDRQKVLPFGSPDDAEIAVSRVRRALDDGSGGIIAQCEWGKGVNAENVKKVFETWL